ncbi:hypothetical protein IU500_12390 [Nocardia terpenica]|uniref:VG15 protein n=1 Tax=Nocardia terpenica TaxID=455432 RepID=UPI0018947C02|nr:hypothetical protein [Nocardia terpenica]MBF6063024.1 hypothetical protein [Nocardia terpenica]MBF6104841.1 hypothetical protein [Nocardia terpenica]MBF6112722.1 hypothetical protein [Nocardia terpenica]MBF6118569.1 hypothetical protein [Nocardia terpenica]MBF6155048.1 hypothetical protein [Nocardia terpenica]
MFLSDPTPQARAALVDLLMPRLLAARERSYDVAVEFLHAQRVAQRVPGAAAVPEIRYYDPEYLDRAIVNALANFPNATEDAVVAAVAKHGEHAARAVPFDSAQLYNHTVAATADTDRVLRIVHDSEIGSDTDDSDTDEDHGDEDDEEPQGWARMLTGADNCALCVVLASRGAVYHTRRTALYKRNGDPYHLKCDCIAVPVFDRSTWPGWREAKRLEAFYIEATKAHPNVNQISAVRRRLTELDEPIVTDLRSAA